MFLEIKSVNLSTDGIIKISFDFSGHLEDFEKLSFSSSIYDKVSKIMGMDSWEDFREKVIKLKEW